MNRKQKQSEQRSKVDKKMCCTECRSSGGTLYKVKKPNGGKIYLCKFCLDSYQERNN